MRIKKGIGSSIDFCYFVFNCKNFNPIKRLYHDCRNPLPGRLHQEDNLQQIFVKQTKPGLNPTEGYELLFFTCPVFFAQQTSTPTTSTTTTTLYEVRLLDRVSQNEYHENE